MQTNNGIWFIIFYSSFSLIPINISLSSSHSTIDSPPPISTLPYSFFFHFPFCSILFLESWATISQITPHYHLINSIISLIYKISFISFSPPFVRSLLSVLSHTPNRFCYSISVSLIRYSISVLPIRYSISVLLIRCILWRFHRFADSLKVSSIHRFSEGFINLFYIYYVQLSSPSSLWFSWYFGVYFYSLYLLSSYVLCAMCYVMYFFH